MQGSAIYRVVWYAATLHILTLFALLAAGMLFAVDDSVAVTAVVSTISVAIWGVAALVIIPIGVTTLVRQLRQDKAAEPFRDPWLDD